MDSQLWPGGRRCHRRRQRTEVRALGGAARRKVDSVSGPFLDGAASLLPPSGVGFVLTCVCVCAHVHTRAGCCSWQKRCRSGSWGRLGLCPEGFRSPWKPLCGPRAAVAWDPGGRGAGRRLSHVAGVFPHRGPGGRPTAPSSSCPRVGFLGDRGADFAYTTPRPQ